MSTKTDNVGILAKTPAISVVEMGEAYLDQVLTLFGECLGRGYVTPAHLNEFIRASGGRKKGFVAVLAGEVVGAVTCLVVPTEEIEAVSLIPFDILKKFLPQDLLAGKVGLVKSIAVHESYRKQGIGRALLISALGWLGEAGAAPVFVAAWVPGKTCNACGLLEASGFRRLFVIREFWYRDSVKKGYSCPANSYGIC